MTHLLPITVECYTRHGKKARLSEYDLIPSLSRAHKWASLTGQILQQDGRADERQLAVLM
jgi:hypothetical protein